LKITVDTNLLLRVLTEDHPQQTEQAKAALSVADSVVAPTMTICETVWVLKSSHGLSAPEIAQIIRSVVGNPEITVDHAPVRAGLIALDEDGDFADGVIAYEGRRLGGEVFTSFDRKAVKLLQVRGMRAHLLH
jgi:predicted nucleic-acid-binding protein